MMGQTIQTIGIIGGGIVGISTAYQMSRINPQCRIVVFEKEAELALHQTGNNSGVIHSGIYYKPGSLKAQNCVNGYQLLIDFCKEHQIDFDICGKVIVATKEDQLGALDKLFLRGKEHGLEGIKWLDAAEIQAIEPNCSGIKGIYVPQTGIVNYKQIVLTLEKLLGLSINIKIVKQAEVVGFHVDGSKIAVQLKGQQSVVVDRVVNCAGLHCDRVANLAGEKLDVRIIPFRGEYYKIKQNKSYLVKNLIYPVPDANFPFLGVHFTRRINGEIEAGPNAVFAFKREGYRKTDFSIRDFWGSVFWWGFQKVAFKYWKTGLGEYYRSFSKRAFTKALQELVPEIQESDLEPAGAGVRAQACDKRGNLIDDFYIEETDRFIHVLNAPSPAATSSFSIGLHIAELVLKKLNNG
jgi:L-2-hydroxyglutarate oxidase